MSESAADLAATVRESLPQPGKSRHQPAYDALDALVARCEQAERERDKAREMRDLALDACNDHERTWLEAEARAESAEARVAELETALRPFAVCTCRISDVSDDCGLCHGCVARAALAAAPADTEGGAA